MLQENIIDQWLLELIEDFTTGLLKKANCYHAGNCLTMSQVLKYYLEIFNIKSELMNAKVKQGRNRINHYFLRLEDGTILDATASQFRNMPKIYIGVMPVNYLNPKTC